VTQTIILLTEDKKKALLLRD